jgi:hypothetical protein
MTAEMLKQAQEGAVAMGMSNSVKGLQSHRKNTGK